MSQRKNLGRNGDELSANGRPFTPPPASVTGTGPGTAGTIGSSRVDPATGISSSQYYHQQQQRPHHHYGSGFVVDDEQDFEQSLSAQQRQMLELENENIVKKLETELNQVR